MKAKVIRAYTDKHTQEIHRIGETVELKADRARELSEGGFVEPVPKPQAPKTAGKKKD